MVNYKSAPLQLSVSPQAATNIKTNIAFYTQDFGSAQLTFAIFKDTKPLDLTGATAKLTFVMADNSTFQVDATIDDAINGLVSYVLLSDILQHYGKATAELNIYWGTDQGVSAGQFQFVINASLTDQDNKPVTQFYIESIEDLKADVSQAQTDMQNIQDLISQNQVAKQSDLDATNEILTDNTSQQKDFNISDTPASYFTSLCVPQGLITQGFYIAQNGKYIFANVSDGLTPESFTLYRLTSTGKLLDSMTLTSFGHGTVLGIEDVGGDTFIWTNMGVSDTTNSLVRFKYVAGASYTSASPEVTSYSNFGSGEDVYPSIDGDKIIFCRNLGSGNSWRIEKRNLSDVKAGTNVIVSQITIPISLLYMQGFCVDGDTLYWLTGDAYEVGNYPQLLTEFSFASQQQNAQIDLSFAPVEANRKEPEGLFLYTDSITGAKSLFVGITSNDYIQKNNKVYAFHSLINSRTFQGYKMEDIPRNIANIQPQLITGYDGRMLFNIASGSSIADTLKNFKGLATVYVSAGATDSPDTTSSGRVLANLSDVGTGYLQWIDYQNRMWYVSMSNGVFNTYAGIDTWQRLMTYDLLEKPWNTFTLLNGVTVGWSYPPQYRRINNRVQIKGAVLPGTNSTIANLPSGYRSSKQIRKAVAGDGSSTAMGRMTITTAGDIVIDFNTLTTVWIDFEFDVN